MILKHFGMVENYLVSYLNAFCFYLITKTKCNYCITSGSPFHLQIVNLNNVRPVGDWKGILNAAEHIPLNLNEEKRLSFDVSGAGPGMHS